jgi:predicted phosphodiesterase
VEPVAIISDIHANAEALEAVLKDIRGNGVHQIICLGDLMGYGPDPERVVDMVQDTCSIVIAGNHDWGVLKRPLPFNEHAAELLRIHQCKMTPRFFNILGRKRIRWKYLEALKSLYQDDGVMYVHGSVRNHVIEYVYPDSSEHFNIDQITAVFKKVNRIMFCGHTHLSCVIRDDFECRYGTDQRPEVQLTPGHKYIINPGSVGQPRDGNPRAGYAIFFGDKIVFRRVIYDVQKTCKKMMEIDGAGRLMASRLWHGH